MRNVDPITLSTTWHYLQRVCREMRQTAERTAANVLVATLHDLAYGIWDKDGRPVAIPEGFPPRLIASTVPIKRVLEKFVGDIHPGDQFLTNYPPDGAIHLHDWVFVRPIFYRDELVFFVCMGTHVADNGGAEPGSHFLAHDPIGEGLNIPLTRIVRNDQICSDVADLILANNRLPELMRREMACLMGSNAIAERRLIELLDRYGRDVVYDCIEEMIERTESAVRNEIRKWPDGTYRAEAQTDDDGATMDVPITVRVTLTIANDEATFDFSESDRQVKGMINSFIHQTESNTLCTAFLFLGAALAPYHNAGSLRPFRIIAKPGTFVSAQPGALTAAAPAVGGGVVIEAVLSALSQALPDRAIAPYSRLMGPLFVGHHPKADGLYVYTSFCATAGAGAVAGFDGYQCATDIGTLGVVGKSDAEDEMARFPWEVLRYEYRTDAHGAGKWRGAPGLIWEAVNESGPVKSHGGPWSGFTTKAQGQQGGFPSPNNAAHVLRGDQKIIIEHPHIAWTMQEGDHLICLAGGGAGVGPPAQRNPEMVREDVRNGLVSLAWARDIYKVVLDSKTFEIDEEATRALRASVA